MKLKIASERPRSLLFSVSGLVISLAVCVSVIPLEAGLPEGQAKSGLAPACTDADFDHNDAVGVTDLLTLLAQWGANPDAPADLDGDGDTEIVIPSWSLGWSYDNPVVPGYVFALDLPGRPTAIEWGTLAHDATRIGAYHRRDP